ncbi:MAG: 4Fe-4S dicluster domain-containing protein [Gammaproteobacteria bacterium]|nr:4Fe-4S dicluster domain-containing protein [Gammaproteobacteria bacterium]
MSNVEAREQAVALYDAFEFEPTSLLSYRSAGKLLALGDEAALRKCADLPASIDLTPIAVADGRASISGYLGAFVVEIAGPGDEQHRYQGDAILDLGEAPLLARELLPPGYFHLPPAAWNDTQALAELGELRGEFQKPGYFDYDAAICAHSVNGKIACRQCLDACPAEAIKSLGDIIEVDPYLCQGGGSCTTVCPSGAIRYLYPNLRDNGLRLRDTLACYTEQGGEAAIVLFHAQDFSPLPYLQAYENLLPVAVEEVASAGTDLCLSALAYGAAQVVLYLDGQVPVSSVANLERQVDWVQELIIGLGLQRESITICRHEVALASLDSARAIEAAEYDMPPHKRDAILQALDHLVARLQPAAEWVDLPGQAPFGEAVIDAEKCTLCMACVGACPGRALQDGSNRELPEVFFIESNCLQCGACVQTCPEDAIGLTPRLLLQSEARNRARALNRDRPFACISCGKPFAPTSVIHKMQEKLKDHYMFAGERALDRLKMCEDCRVVDIVQDPEAMGGQFNPDKDFRQ